MEPSGNGIQVGRGDKVTTLEQRLAEQDREILLLKRLIGGVLVVLLVHAVAPELDLFHTLLQLIGL
jgi:hypothetical protein